MSKPISLKDIAKEEKKVQRELDTIYIMPHTKTIEIRTFNKYLDNDSKEVRRKAGSNIIFMDREADVDRGIEASTAYTDFLAAAGINIDTIVDAVVAST